MTRIESGITGVGDAALETRLTPTRVSLNARAAKVRLDEDALSEKDVVGVLNRFGRRIRDEEWAVAVEGNVLHATKHRGVFYKSLSVVDRLTRGEIVCWQEGGQLRIDFRPDWIPLLIDAVLLAAALRWVLQPLRGGFLLDLALFAPVACVVAVAQIPMMRSRFHVLLSRAAWIGDAEWDRARARARWRHELWWWARLTGLALGTMWWIPNTGMEAWYSANVLDAGHWVKQALLVLTIGAVAGLVMLDIATHVRKEK